MQRSRFQPAAQMVDGKAMVVRARKCKAPGCRQKFMPDAPHVTWCSPECGAIIAQGELAKLELARAAAAKRAKKAERIQDAGKREAFKRRGVLIAEVQKWFNLVVRLEDAALPCISCGKFIADNGRPGGVWDAGHYLARAQSPHLRFDRRNVHKQCKGCNRPGGCTRAAFRAGLVDRIGLAAVEALESDQTVQKWSKDELRAMRDYYRQRAGQLKKELKQCSL